MWSTYTGLVAAPPLLLLGAGLIPSRWANRHVSAMRRSTVVLLAAVLSLSAMATALLVRQGPLDAVLWRLPGPLPLNLGVYFDSLAAVMLLLISFVGLIIARYSVRYLDGEATQGRFLRWIAFTLGAVLLLVVSRNLVMLTAAWMLTSFGLHQLLTHYPDRPWAIWAARKKFLISRLGDLLLHRGAGVSPFTALAASTTATSLRRPKLCEQTRAGEHVLISLIGTLYVLGAMTKSAQFPFHSWLPDTMETPTPVSALDACGNHQRRWISGDPPQSARVAVAPATRLPGAGRCVHRAAWAAS